MCIHTYHCIGRQTVSAVITPLLLHIVLFVPRTADPRSQRQRERLRITEISEKHVSEEVRP